MGQPPGIAQEQIQSKGQGQYNQIHIKMHLSSSYNSHVGLPT
jgi:hypothetical protein